MVEDFSDKKSESKNTDDMHLNFDKRFKRSIEAKVLRTINKFIYGCTRKGMFGSLAVILGVIFAILWGTIMGVSEFSVIWVLLPAVDVIKRLLLPAVQFLGRIVYGIYGQCLRNYKTQPALFTFEGITGNNAGLEYKKLETDSNDDDYNQKFDEHSTEGDEFSLQFVKAFTKYDACGVVLVEEACYDACRTGIYNLLAVVLGIPLSFVWGLVYGVLQFIIKWILNPAFVCHLFVCMCE